MEFPPTTVSLCEMQTPVAVACFLMLLLFLAELPGPPTNMAISNIGPRSVTLQFKPGYDGKTSISRWQVEAQVSHSSQFGSF